MNTLLPPAFVPKRIAVFRALALGDLLVATPALAAVRLRWPEARIDLIGLPWAEEYVRRWNTVDRLMPFRGHPGIPESPADASVGGTASPSVEGERYDLAIQLHGSGEQSNDVVRELGAAYSIGFGPLGDRRLDFVLPWVEAQQETERWLGLVRAVGCGGNAREIAFPISDAERRQADNLLSNAGASGGPLIGLHIGAKDERRRWPVERFSRLAALLSAELGARIVLTGSNDDRPLTQSVAERSSGEVVDLAGQTGIGEYGAVIAALDLLVTNDTSASHVAAAVGTPSVVLFGPTDPRRWAPLDLGRHRAVRAGSRDIRDIPVDEVLMEARQQLARHAGKPRLDRPQAAYGEREVRV